MGEQIHRNIDSPSPKYWVVQLPVHPMGPDSDWPENKNYDKDPEFHLSSGKPTWNKKVQISSWNRIQTQRESRYLKVVAFISKMLLMLCFLVRKEDTNVTFLYSFLSKNDLNVMLHLPSAPPTTFCRYFGKTAIGMNHPDRHSSCTLASLSNTAALGLRRQDEDQQELWFKALVSMFTRLGISFVSVDLTG